MDMRCLAVVDERATIVFAVGEETDQLDRRIGEVEEHLGFVVRLVSQVFGLAVIILDVIAGA